MAEEKEFVLLKGKNAAMAAIAIFVMIQFHASASCDLHGFSPQADKNDSRSKRDGKSFRENRQIVGEFSKRGELLTGEIHLKQGRLKGIVREFKSRHLKSVETFFGIPYAAPPVRALRFMPPGSPPTWQHVRIFDDFGPVCPQTPPDLSREPLKTMNAGHYNRLKRLMPFLSNQSEDCLYLNVYAPVRDQKNQKKFPVVVYIHGESFEWNSGNPYDGSVLASYGNVVVVTVNFRLGILGFLKPGLSEHTVSNFGLLDQIAALQWIKDNIKEFGGDSSMVTLMGQGTGAACINFLMVSPVSMASEGLFHKAILMSGTALSDWAITNNPLQVTIQVAEALNCPLIEKNDELSNCLRKKRLSEIMSVNVKVDHFQTPFGPVVDGSVVPNVPQQVMGVYRNLFTRYDLVCGMTEWETYHALDPVSLTYGMLEGERNDVLRKYMHSRFEALPYFALATTLSEYLNRKKPEPYAKASAAEEHRDLVLDLLSDARFAAPVIQMASYHSKINRKSYLYLFQHKSKLGEFAGSDKSVSGEEIPYMLGIPLLNEESPLSHHKFSLSEQLLSESILTYLTNFAKTGNPNVPGRSRYFNLGPKEWRQFDIYWPEYDSNNQSYLALGIPPRVGHHYRSHMMQFWNEILPNLLSDPTQLKREKVDVPFEEHSKWVKGKKTNSTFDSFRGKTTGNEKDWIYGRMRTSPEENRNGKRFFRDEDERIMTKQMDRPVEGTGKRSDDEGNQSTWVPYLAAITVCLLAINAVFVAIYYLKRKRKKNVKPDGGRKSNEVTESFYAGSDMAECNQTKTEIKEQGKKTGKLRKVLTNTSESSTRVKKWFRTEILEKCTQQKTGPKNSTKKSSIVSEGSSGEISHPIKPILKNSRRVCKSDEDLGGSPRKGVRKVSIGIDATPSAMGASVLKQTPIEITKSLDRGMMKIEPDSFDETSEKALKTVRKSRTSVSLQILTADDDFGLVNSTEPEVIRLEPKTEVSVNNFRTFGGTNDVNVTSRDPEVVPIPEGAKIDPLENIQKRNFPKVLPDFPDFKAAKRLSFPQSSRSNVVESNRNKLFSSPPPPPPRVSTLRRKDVQNIGDPAKEPEPFTGKDRTLARDEGKIDNEKGENSESSIRAEDKIEEPEGNKSTTQNPKKKREQPKIVIRPKTGPKRSLDDCRKAHVKKARVNLQVNQTKTNSQPSQLDSKGPSDKLNRVTNSK